MCLLSWMLNAVTMIIPGLAFGAAGILMAGLALGISDSHAIELKNAPYFSTVEFAGGLAFNETLKKWEASKLPPEDKFVLKLQFVSTRVRRASWARTRPSQISM